MQSIVDNIQFHMADAAPVIVMVAFFVLLAIGVIRVLCSERDKKLIRRAFSHYISSDYIDELTQNPDGLKVGGEIRELSVMFADIRDFATISENLKPDELVSLLNDFLTPMSEQILSHRGTIDKYMGDSIMSFWNAPLDDAHHARNACQAALAMRASLQPINAALKAQVEAEGQVFMPLRVGIGINTGPCAVGNMGSKYRFAYSALGDAVNIAARLEGLTKIYKLDILIGENTQVFVRDLATLEIDWIRVKGRKEPLQTYALLGDEKLASGKKFKNWKMEHEKMLLAYQNKQFEVALTLIDICRSIQMRDMTGFYDLYEARIRDYMRNPPPDNWDGVYVATSK